LHRLKNEKKYKIGYWLLDIVYWLVGYWLLGIGYWLLAIGYCLLAGWLLATPLFRI
jgi:hypothetical protein